jgi:uncharacterized protein (DUF433 family)
MTYNSKGDRLMAPQAKVVHSHITKRKGYCGGRPIIKGTKFPVRSIVVYVLQ